MTVKKAVKKPASKADLEREVKRAIWKEFGAHKAMRIVLFARDVGLFQTRGENSHPIKVGETGSPDLDGFISLNFITQRTLNASGFQPYVQTIESLVAVKLYIETKRKGNKGGLSTEQETFRKGAIANGCIHIVADSVEDVYAGIEEYLNKTGATL
jgi:hypothetical protein